jgi:hypothetical protein
LATLAYFNMFHYPLRKSEVFTFLGHAHNQEEFELVLEELIKDVVVFKLGEYYSLRNEYALVERRCKGNKKAVSMIKTAEKSASVISAFPFVLGVAVSGSLSKNFADKDADVDFFIITAANRLWIARTFLHIFKKFTYLFNRQHFYCMNYFIDEQQTVILEKNIYTATEIVTLLPLTGSGVFEKFFSANNWTRKFLPNNYPCTGSVKNVKRSWLRSFLESMLNNNAGKKVNILLMKWTAKNWRSKTRKQKKNSKGIVMSLHTGTHFCKPDPDNYQKRLLHQYNINLMEVFEMQERALAQKTIFSLAK